MESVTIGHAPDTTPDAFEFPGATGRQTRRRCSVAQLCALFWGRLGRNSDRPTTSEDCAHLRDPEAPGNRSGDIGARRRPGTRSLAGIASKFNGSLYDSAARSRKNQAFPAMGDRLVELRVRRCTISEADGFPRWEH